MSEIDLIPGTYREKLWRITQVRRFSVLATLMIAATVAGAALLGYQARVLAEEVRIFEEQRAISAQQRSELETLNRQKSGYQGQLQLLGGLRSGARIDQVLLTVDDALNDHPVWFERWDFKRAGVVTESGPQQLEGGYFIMADPAQSGDKNEPLQIETHMLIQGQARDHAALSSFVSNLFQQPEIVDVKLQRTSQRREGTAVTVDFGLTIVLNSEARS